MIRIKYQKNKIVIGSAFEYEDILTMIVLQSLPDSFNSEISVSGKIISGSDFTKTLHDFGLDLDVQAKKEKESNKVQNYICNINAKTPLRVTKGLLLDLFKSLQSSCYLLLTFTIYLCPNCLANFPLKPSLKMHVCESCGHEEKKPSVEFSVKTKTNPPRPTTKQKGVPKTESQKMSSKIKFCSIVLSNTESTQEMILNEIAPDFRDEIPTKLKTLELVNNYHINNLVLPPRELMKNSELFRKLTIREGTLERILQVDGNSFETVTQFKI
jgi:hypothetical protein